MSIEVNSNCVNKKIIPHILSDEEMISIGFKGVYYEGTDYEAECPYWYFIRPLNVSKGLDIDFCVKIPKDGSDIRIDVLDTAYCQPYDYQYILSKNPTFATAQKVQEEVEKWMEYLQDKKVLSGHVKGEYI